MFEPYTSTSVLKIVTTAAGTEIRYDDELAGHLQPLRLREVHVEMMQVGEHHQQQRRGSTTRRRACWSSTAGPCTRA